jgi:hypothetical protein
MTLYIQRTLKPKLRINVSELTITGHADGLTLVGLQINDVTKYFIF